jgi:hypothetical protein
MVNKTKLEKKLFDMGNYLDINEEEFIDEMKALLQNTTYDEILEFIEK